MKPHPQKLAEELIFWRTLAHQSIEDQKSLFQNNCQLNKLIYLLVKRAGGEVRLNGLDAFGLDCEWELVTTTDPETGEFVMKARRKKVANELAALKSKLAIGVTCENCGGYLPGHATGAGDICSCER